MNVVIKSTTCLNAHKCTNAEISHCLPFIFLSSKERKKLPAEESPIFEPTAYFKILNVIILNIILIQRTEWPHTTTHCIAPLITGLVNGLTQMRFSVYQVNDGLVRIQERSIESGMKTKRCTRVVPIHSFFSLWKREKFRPTRLCSIFFVQGFLLLVADTKPDTEASYSSFSSQYGQMARRR